MNKMKKLILLYVYILTRNSFCGRSLLESGAYVSTGGIFASGAVWIHENKVLTRCSLVDYSFQNIYVFLYIEPTRSYLVGWTICQSEYRTERHGSNLVTKNDYAILITLENFRPSFYLKGKFDLESRDDWQVDRLDEDLEELLDEHERKKDKCQIVFYPTLGQNVSAYRPVPLNCTLESKKNCILELGQNDRDYINAFSGTEDDKLRCLVLEDETCPPNTVASVLVDDKNWGLLYECFGRNVFYTSFDRIYHFIYQFGLTKGSGIPAT